MYGFIKFGFGGRHSIQLSYPPTWDCAMQSALCTAKILYLKDVSYQKTTVHVTVFLSYPNSSAPFSLQSFTNNIIALKSNYA